MLLKEILNLNSDINVEGIGYGNSCRKGDLYFCLHDGERLVADMIFAESRSAAAVVFPAGAAQTTAKHFPSSDIRRDFALASAAFYGNPADKLITIGVTGTNGKTTVTHIIKSIMDEAGRKTGLIGTNGVYIGDKKYPATLTTPDPPELHGIFARMLNEGVDTVVMEVSAHALALKKTEGIKFTVSAFTNLTQDHLDFFGSMEEYKKAKLSLFTDFP